MNKVKYLIVFAAGVGTGAIASRVYFKKKYEAIADEEIDSVKAAYSYKKAADANPQTEQTDDILEEIERKKIEYRDMLDREGYISEEKVELVRDDHPREEVGGVYEITEEDYSETELSYEKLTLQYFVDDDILFNPEEANNENGGIVVEQTIGDEGINRVRTSDDTFALYFRNDTYCTDYEVTKVSGSFYGE